MLPVGIIGGMGPFAGAQYLSHFLNACTDIIVQNGQDVSDQRFPPHYVLQHPVADRTTALIGSADEYAEVLASLSGQIDVLGRLGVKAIGIACNTAHAWYGELRAMHSGIELIHVGDVTARCLYDSGEKDVCVLATLGTIKSGIYAQSLSTFSIGSHEPDAQELGLIMAGIYDGVKAGRYDFGRDCFTAAATRMAGRTGVASFLLACTEIPLALTAADLPASCRLYDPTRFSARALAMRALGQR